MEWTPCPDPVRKNCGWSREPGPTGACWREVSGYHELQEVVGPALVRVPVELLDAPRSARVRLELRCSPQAVPPLPACESPWTLLLAAFQVGEDDDLGALSETLTRARQAGCDLVQCESPEADFAYKYRVLTLMRSLCDEHGLRFSILERPDTPEDQRLNRYLCSQKPCCRALP